MDTESILAVHIGETEEESFEYESDLLNFERTKKGFEFTYINFQDEKITKSFEIKSKSVIEDENGILVEWDDPYGWAIDEQ